MIANNYVTVKISMYAVNVFEDNVPVRAESMLSLPAVTQILLRKELDC
jgi:hypothetical protein